MKIGLADGMGIELVNRLVEDLACWLVSSLADCKAPRRSKGLVEGNDRDKKVINRRL